MPISFSGTPCTLIPRILPALLPACCSFSASLFSLRASRFREPLRDPPAALRDASWLHGFLARTRFSGPPPPSEAVSSRVVSETSRSPGASSRRFLPAFLGLAGDLPDVAGFDSGPPSRLSERHHLFLGEAFSRLPACCRGRCRMVPVPLPAPSSPRSRYIFGNGLSGVLLCPHPLGPAPPLPASFLLVLFAGLPASLSRQRFRRSSSFLRSQLWPLPAGIPGPQLLRGGFLCRAAASSCASFSVPRDAPLRPVRPLPPALIPPVGTLSMASAWTPAGRVSVVPASAGWVLAPRRFFLLRFFLCSSACSSSWEAASAATGSSSAPAAAGWPARLIASLPGSLAMQSTLAFTLSFLLAPPLLFPLPLFGCRVCPGFSLRTFGTFHGFGLRRSMVRAVQREPRRRLAFRALTVRVPAGS